jgi:hypothetical protein
LQRPHPAFWYGIGTPDSAEYYGERGFHGVTLAKPAAASEITRRFDEASAHCGWRGRRMWICRFIVVGETDHEAQDLAARAYPVWHASFFELFRRYGQKPVQIWPARFEEMAASGLAFAGSPFTLTRRCPPNYKQSDRIIWLDNSSLATCRSQRARNRSSCSHRGLCPHWFMLTALNGKLRLQEVEPAAIERVGRSAKVQSKL